MAGVLLSAMPEIALRSGYDDDRIETVPADMLRVVRLAEKLGVRVILCGGFVCLSSNGRSQMLGFSEAPTHLGGIVYHAKRDPTLLWADFRERDAACGLAHELAHVLLDEPPDDVHEPDAMLGIEHAIVKRCRLRWSNWMTGYSIGMSTSEWHEMSTAERHKYLVRSRRLAIAGGYLTRDGKLYPFRKRGRRSRTSEAA